MRRKILGVLALAALFTSILVGMGQAEANASPQNVDGVATVLHVDSSLSRDTCNATRPYLDFAPLYHTHVVTLSLTFVYVSCETWTGVSGSGNHGCTWHAYLLKGDPPIPFGPIGEMCH